MPMGMDILSDATHGFSQEQLGLGVVKRASWFWTWPMKGPLPHNMYPAGNYPTPPKTSMTMEYPPFKMYFLLKMGIF